MRLTVDGKQVVSESKTEQAHRRVALDVTGHDIDGEQLVRAIRGEAVAPIQISCVTPDPVHEYIGYIHENRTVSLRQTLAAVARSRGWTAPQDEQLADARARLADYAVPTVDLTAAKQRVAETGTEEASLREDVAAARGRLDVLRDVDAEEPVIETAKTTLRTAVERLATVETDRIAAEQRLAQVRTAAYDAHSVRQRRLELQDEVGNLERAARESLAVRLYDEFRETIREMPGDASPGVHPSTYDGETATVLLAAARLADVRAPLVLDFDVPRFSSATDAAECLKAPVIRL